MDGGFVQIAEKEWRETKRIAEIATENAKKAANRKVRPSPNEDWLLKLILRFNFWMNELIREHTKKKWDIEYERALKQSKR